MKTENKEQGIMLCPLCKEIVDIPDDYKEYFFKQGIKKAIDVIKETELEMFLTDIDSHRKFIDFDNLLEKLNQEVENGC